MKKKTKNDLKFLKSGRSYYITLIFCLVIFLGAIAMLISGFNMLIKQHDEKLSQEICTLVSEKMGNSLLFMTDSAKNVASVLSTQDFETPEEIYEKLKDYNSGEIVSLGFIDENEKVFYSKSDIDEFGKNNLLKTAKLANPVSISEPYRSTRLGQPVITLFTEFDYGKTHKGYLCLTYLFTTLQEVASTESLNNDIEIWLMNAKSANIIQCVGSDVHASGSWANAYLKMNDINEDDRQAFGDWYNKMLTGLPNASVSYMINDTTYSQVYSTIDSMPGWCVVVRIPGNALSQTMNKFRNYVIVFLFVFLNIIIILISAMFISWKREKDILGQLSINDPLTGALNRRAFEVSSEKMLSQSKEVSVIFFDMDFFKQVNDNLGHDAGDKLLVEFSRILKDNFAEYGLVCRYGGDEFVVAANTNSDKKIDEILSKVMKEVHAIKLEEDNSQNSDLKIAFSAGIAKYPKDAKDISALLKCADSALYNVKKEGRDDYRWYKKDE